MAAKRDVGLALAKAWVALLVLTALFADFLANDRPIVASVEGNIVFPIARGLSKEYGLSTYGGPVTNWPEVFTDWAWWPPVRYNGSDSDLANGRYRPPFARPAAATDGRHWLGTDRLGRDVLAGLIRGARVATAVGVGSILIGLLIGVPLGAVAGFFGNGSLRSSRAGHLGVVLGTVIGSIYTFISLAPYWDIANGSLLLLILITFVAVLSFGFTKLFRLIPALRRSTTVPADGIVLQLLEVFVNIPGLVFLLAILSFAPEASIWLLTLVIGVLTWPTIARFVRAEFLRIRSLPYIEAAFSSNVNVWRILFYHALPNASGPLTVVIAFAIGGAILAEGFLSFLGIGVPSDVATWGTLLRRSRDQPTAWWLAVFPGLMLTFTILSIQVIGDRRR